MTDHPPAISLQQQHHNRIGRKPNLTVPSLQLMKFGVGKLNFALPIQAVFKVTPYGSVHGSGLSDFGLTQIDGLEVTVVDLYRRVFKSPQTGQKLANQCLLIVQGQTRELYGLVSDDTPTLMDVPLSMVRILPESYRQADTLDMASHVAVIPHGEQKLTIFLLDIKQFLKQMH